MDNILRGLNDAQKAAVSSPASVLQVLAPPGSGKTKTLTARVAYLISNGLAPGNIIVCTFTVKAAKEMKERIEGFLGFHVACNLILGTFHSICRRFLVSHGHLIGLREKFSIADASDSKGMISRIIKQNKFSINSGQARGRISGLKANRISAEQHAASSDAKAFVDQEELTRVYSEYEELLKASSLLDYDDLLLRCADLLRHFPGCVSNVEAVLIDEFQDTNNVQYDLMRLFAEKRSVISIVGDPDQSIYGWRSAKIENLRRMTAHYPDTHVATLEENYRSSGCILLAAQQVIEQDLERPQKSLAPTHSIGVPPTMRRLKAADVEAYWIVNEVQRILALTGGLLNWDDFAILLRSASLSRLIETALGKAGIPHRVVGGHRFFDRFEVRLVLDYLRVLDHPDHTDALLRIINCPPRQVGGATLEKLIDHATKYRSSLWQVVLQVSRGEVQLSRTIGGQSQKGIETFVNLVITQRQKLLDAPGSTLTDFVKGLVAKLQLQSFLTKKYPDKEDHDERWSNVQELIAQASEVEVSVASDATQDDHAFENDTQLSRDQVLSHFLANVALSSSSEEETKDGQKRGQITLSTMHAAKGLEWPIIFIPSTYEGSIPHSRAENADEERRLLYVAMTRAQGILYLSCPAKDSVGNTTVLSHFLSPEEVVRQLTDYGPNLNHDMVRELAQILRRPCPSAQQIELGRSSLSSLKDNKFPQVIDKDENNSIGSALFDFDDYRSESDDRYQRPQKRYWQEKGNDTISYKKQHISTSMAGFQASTTMGKTAEYSISKTSITTAFVSAKELPKGEVSSTSLPSAASQIHKSTNNNQHCSQNRSKPSAKLRPGQCTLTSFVTVGHPRTTTADKSISENVLKNEEVNATPALADISNMIPSEGTNLRDSHQKHEMPESHARASSTPRPSSTAPSSNTTKKSLGTGRGMIDGWASRKNR